MTAVGTGGSGLDASGICYILSMGLEGPEDKFRSGGGRSQTHAWMTESLGANRTRYAVLAILPTGL